MHALLFHHHQSKWRCSAGRITGTGLVEVKLLRWQLSSDDAESIIIAFPPTFRQADSEVNGCWCWPTAGGRTMDAEVVAVVIVVIALAVSLSWNTAHTNTTSHQTTTESAMRHFFHNLTQISPKESTCTCRASFRSV